MVKFSIIVFMTVMLCVHMCVCAMFVSFCWKKIWDQAEEDEDVCEPTSTLEKDEAGGKSSPSFPVLEENYIDFIFAEQQV